MDQAIHLVHHICRLMYFKIFPLYVFSPAKGSNFLELHLKTLILAPVSTYTDKTKQFKFHIKTSLTICKNIFTVESDTFS